MPEEKKPRKRHPEREHHRSAFTCWYDFDRHFKRTADALEVSEKTVYEWANDFNWRVKADELDAARERDSHKAAVRRQKALLEKQIKAGDLLRLRGMEYLSTTKISRTADAIKAITTGIELERQAEGLPSYLLDLTMKSDEDLYAEKQRLLRLARLEDGSGGAGDRGAEVEAAEDRSGEDGMGEDAS